mmetsp:Transcript_5260/g.9418  ORF Transcript_5260/g.9418 Transcript_5260/m.9418 type:complete len:110 (-) Transcript_5260:151-480(-)
MPKSPIAPSYSPAMSEGSFKYIACVCTLNLLPADTTVWQRSPKRAKQSRVRGIALLKPLRDDDDDDIKSNQYKFGYGGSSSLSDHTLESQRQQLGGSAPLSNGPLAGWF